jgi:CHAT domain-containing protein
LTLAKVIARLNLVSARLVVLSTCESGLIDIRRAPDEFIGLPAGFLEAGTPAVVATLWDVDDISTRLLIERFYRGHLYGLPPAAALRAAQRWLRDISVQEALLDEHYAEVYRTTTDPEQRKMAFRTMRYFKRHPEERPFASPRHWAAFALTGT